jgi:hypothetical protein
LWGEIGERRLVDACGVERAVFGQEVDDHVDELDLVVAVALVVEDVVERLRGRRSIEPDQPGAGQCLPWVVSAERAERNGKT